jgi:hypothetical protein
MLKLPTTEGQGKGIMAMEKARGGYSGYSGYSGYG